MTPYRDFNGVWRITGHERHEFSTESDAQTAIDFAIDFVCYEVNRESRHRRAAERAKEQTV